MHRALLKTYEGMLTGPVTILSWSFPREYIFKRKYLSDIWQFVMKYLIWKQMICVIQVDEAALKATEKK